MPNVSNQVDQDSKVFREFIFSAEFGPNGQRMLSFAPSWPEKAGPESWAGAYGGLVSYESAIDAAGYATEREMLDAKAANKVIMAAVDGSGNMHMVKNAMGKESVITMHELYEAHGMTPPSAEYLASLALQENINAVFMACVTEGMDRDRATEVLSDLIHETQAEVVAKGWFTTTLGSCSSPVQKEAEAYFARDLSEFWIVNENGDNVRIVEQRGDDGCDYRRMSHDKVARLFHDGDEIMISAEFDYHARPFTLEEPAPGL